jgi:hypothetical protein
MTIVYVFFMLVVYDGHGLIANRLRRIFLNARPDGGNQGSVARWPTSYIWR